MVEQNNAPVIGFFLEVVAFLFFLVGGWVGGWERKWMCFRPRGVDYRPSCERRRHRSMVHGDCHFDCAVLESGKANDDVCFVSIVLSVFPL